MAPPEASSPVPSAAADRAWPSRQEPPERGRRALRLRTASEEDCARSGALAPASRPTPSSTPITERMVPVRFDRHSKPNGRPGPGVRGRGGEAGGVFGGRRAGIADSARSAQQKFWPFQSRNQRSADEVG